MSSVGAVRLLLVIGCAMAGVCAGVLMPGAVRHWSEPARDRSARGSVCRQQAGYAAAAGAAFAALAWKSPVTNPAEVLLLLGWLILAGTGLVLSGIDLAVRRLPRVLTAGAAAAIGPLVAAATRCGDPGVLTRSAAAAATVGGGYLVLALAGLVGAGDVHLAALAGLLLGTASTTAVLAGVALPYLLATTLLAVRALGAFAVAIVATLPGPPRTSPSGPPRTSPSGPPRATPPRPADAPVARRDTSVAWGPYLVAGAVLAKVLFP